MIISLKVYEQVIFLEGMTIIITQLPLVSGYAPLRGKKTFICSDMSGLQVMSPWNCVNAEGVGSSYPIHAEEGYFYNSCKDSLWGMRRCAWGNKE